MHWKKVAVQTLLLVVGTVMLCAGVLRGEAATVLSKAIRLCLECVGTVSYTHLTLPTKALV